MQELKARDKGSIYWETLQQSLCLSHLCKIVKLQLEIQQNISKKSLYLSTKCLVRLSKEDFGRRSDKEKRKTSTTPGKPQKFKQKIPPS